jgi:hypothetical protein
MAVKELFLKLKYFNGKGEHKYHLDRMLLNQRLIDLCKQWPSPGEMNEREKE